MDKISGFFPGKNLKRLFLLAAVLFTPACLLASSGGTAPSIGPVRIEFIIFGLILLGVALFHKQTFWVAVIGFNSIVDI